MMRSIIPALVAISLSSLARAQAVEAPREGCACVPAFNDPSVSPFSMRTDITRVTPYQVTESNGKRSLTSLEGAVIYLRPMPGITTELLQHALERHGGYMASAGQAMPDCPLAVPGASVTVASTGDGFAVVVASKDRDGAREILRRAEALVIP